MHGGRGPLPVAMMPLLPADPRQFGEFRVLGRLGPGGMGQAFLAEATDGWVVVKTVPSDVLVDPDLASRLRREVEAIRRIDSPHVARVLAADLAGHRPWFAMEYVPGPTLRQRVAQGPVPVHELAELGLGIAHCLEATHDAAVVHRDVKPDNVVLAQDGPRLIDFGIAALPDATSLTAVGSMVGTIAWMAPEQVSRSTVTTATDVHGWGLVLLYAATGARPFEADTEVAALDKVLHVSPAVPTEMGQPLAGLVTRALAKEPGQRPTAKDLIHALTTGPTAHVRGDRFDGGSGHPQRRRRPVPIVIGVVLLLGLLVAAGLRLLDVPPSVAAHPGTPTDPPSSTQASPTATDDAGTGPAEASPTREPSWTEVKQAFAEYRDTLGGDWSGPIPGGTFRGVRPLAVAAQLADGSLTIHTFTADGWAEAGHTVAPGSATTMESRIVDTTGGGGADILTTLTLGDGTQTGTVVFNYGRFAVFRDSAGTHQFVPGLTMSDGGLANGDGVGFAFESEDASFTLDEEPTPSSTPEPPEGLGKPPTWPAYEFAGPAQLDVCQVADFPLPGRLLSLGDGGAGADDPESAVIQSAQAGLRSLNYGQPTPVEVTGYFDDATQLATSSFQRRKGLVVDGKLGQQTWSALHRWVNAYSGNCP